MKMYVLTKSTLSTTTNMKFTSITFVIGWLIFIVWIFSTLLGTKEQFFYSRVNYGVLKEEDILFIINIRDCFYTIVKILNLCSSSLVFTRLGVLYFRRKRFTRTLPARKWLVSHSVSDFFRRELVLKTIENLFFFGVTTDFVNSTDERTDFQRSPCTLSVIIVSDRQIFFPQKHLTVIKETTHTVLKDSLRQKDLVEINRS